MCVNVRSAIVREAHASRSACEYWYIRASTNLGPAVNRQPLFPRGGLEELVKSIRNVLNSNMLNDNGFKTEFRTPNKHPNKPNRMTSKDD